MSQKTSKTTVETVLWSSFGRYKVGMNVSYNGSVWVNTTGKNSEPGVGSDFLVVDGGGSNSLGDISTTTLTFVNGNTGDLDYTVFNGILIMNGTFDVDGVSSNSIIAQLPLGARPSTPRTKIFYQGIGILKLEIHSNGFIYKTTDSTETFNVDFEITLNLATV